MLSLPEIFLMIAGVVLIAIFTTTWDVLVDKPNAMKNAWLAKAEQFETDECEE